MQVGKRAESEGRKRRGCGCSGRCAGCTLWEATCQQVDGSAKCRGEGLGGSGGTSKIEETCRLGGWAGAWASGHCPSLATEFVDFLVPRRVLRNSMVLCWEVALVWIAFGISAWDLGGALFFGL